MICASGRTVVGVYVDSSNGGGRFATFNRFAGYPNAAYYEARITTSTSSTSIRVDVGCGGSSSSWLTNNRTNRVTVAGDKTLNTRCSDTTGTRTSCPWPQRGNTTSTNLGAAGNCTWGALEQWKQRTGSYPLWSGNAQDWNTTAEQNGWRVSRVPHRRAIVVFEANVQGSGSIGHVGYVLAVRHVGSGRFDIDIIEMNFNANGGGFNRFSNRTVRHGAGMNYIVSTI